MNYPCANSRCKNNVNKAGEYCPACQEDVKKILEGVWVDAEAEKRKEKIRQDKKHRRDE